LSIGNKKESIEITNLRVAFEVSKTITSEPNPATIRVYNLNQSHRNLITSKAYNKVSLAVGYEELRVIYTGDIIEVVTLRDDLDFIIELTCGDGYKAYTGALVNKTLKAGATDTDILSETTKSMKVGNGVVDLPKDRQLPRGKVLTGNARDIMHKIARNNGANWSVQDGNMVVLPKNKVLADNEGFVLSQETGMIGSPEKTDDGLQITCLCNPALRIGGLVRIQSIIPEYNGDYKITELEHSGDFMSDDWNTLITCTGGKYQKVNNEQKSNST
ncbi:putative phage protein, partial [Photorhabdus asymbiotica]